MSSTNPQPTTITLSPGELEVLIRRVIREELARLLRTSSRSILEDETHEGPDDSEGDGLLLSEALAVLKEYENSPDDWMSWEEFEAELDANELQD